MKGNAGLLRSGRASAAERRRPHNRLAPPIERLLKWQYQPKRREASCGRTAVVRRIAIRLLLDTNPGFRPPLPEVVAAACADAVRLVSAVAKRPRTDLPEPCQVIVEQLLKDAFLP